MTDLALDEDKLMSVGDDYVFDILDEVAVSQYYYSGSKISEFSAGSFVAILRGVILQGPSIAAISPLD